MKDIWLTMYKVLFGITVLFNLVLRISTKDLLIFGIADSIVWLYGLLGMLGICKTVEEESEDGSVVFMIKVPIVQFAIVRVIQVAWCIWRSGFQSLNLLYLGILLICDILLLVIMMIDKSRYSFEYLPDDYKHY